MLQFPICAGLYMSLDSGTVRLVVASLWTSWPKFDWVHVVNIQADVWNLLHFKYLPVQNYFYNSYVLLRLRHFRE